MHFKTARIFSAFLFSAACVLARPVDLRCSHLDSPIGVDDPSPRLSWKLDDKADGAAQKAYRILAASSPENLAAGKADLWDSGKVESSAMLASYAGKKLAPHSKCWWKVFSYDADGAESQSDAAFFETGMGGMENWKGSWISDSNDTAYRPAPYFRTEFSVGKDVKNARAYVAAAGLFELFVNGKAAGDSRLNPMYTRFDRRNLYVTYDVTKLLKSGDNALGVVLGNGWYNHQPVAVWDFHKAAWRARPAFMLDLRIEYADGSVEIVKSDETWKTSSGAIVSNNIYTAEHYDANLEAPKWNLAGFDDSAWQNAIVRAAPSGNVSSQQLHPIRLAKELKPSNVKRLDDKTWLFEFPQNMSGVTKLRAKGEKGTKVRLVHAERLGKDGRADLSNIAVYYRPEDDTDPFQTDIVTLSGGMDEFMPKFNYKGFKYVQVETGVPMKLSEKSLTAYFMHSDVPPVGKISSSSEMINRLWEATNNAYLSNLMGYPTDCPQREKNGWTGDGHLAIETALYNFDGISVYEKWMGDHRDEQRPDGLLPDIIPTDGWGYGPQSGVDWTSTVAIIPWELYLFYGDSRPLADMYESIKLYVDNIEAKHTNEEGLTSFGRGDWVPVRSESSMELMVSIYYYTDVKILAAAAKLFGKEDDFAKYSALAEKIKNAINKKYLDSEKGVYASGTQTELSMALYWGIVPEDMKGKVAANLAKKVEETGFHLDVGVHGAKALLNALSENGRQEAAYKVAVQDTYPSWGWWIVNGATTLRENWDWEGTPTVSSDNHMMFGEIGGWFFKGLGGIRPDPEKPGFEHIILTPYFPKDLNEFEASYDSVRGKIVSKWKHDGKKIAYTVEIPANASAALFLPPNVKGGVPKELKAGAHVFELSFVD